VSALWVLKQSWLDLLFAHWPIERALLARHVPPGLELDLFDGQAWLTVAPFRIEGLRLRGLPGVPTASSFPELNVRTYVRAGGHAGVYFFSLDAASTLAVAGARATLGLNYRRASMRVRRDGERVVYESTRRAEPDVRFRGSYSPIGPPAVAAAGSLDEWLAERYCLFTRFLGRSWRLDIGHAPWPLRPAEASIEINTMASPLGLTLGAPALAHVSAVRDVWAAPPVPVRRASY